MDFIKFLVSKTFLKNLIAAAILLALLIFGLNIYLKNYTHHNEYHLVPDLTNKTYQEAKEILQKRKMNIVIIDTVPYNPAFKKFAIVDQNPHKNDQVKVGRKIYVKLNSNAFPKVSFPPIIGKSKRQAVNLLKAAGLKIGKISEKPYFAEIVLAATHQKDSLKTGMPIPKQSVINLVIGDGKSNAEEDSEEDNPAETTSDNTGKHDASIENTLNNVLGN